MFRWFLARTLRVSRGQKWRRLRVDRWHVGHPWGSVARTRVFARFRQRVNAKKKKKKGVLSALQAERIGRIKAVKAGTARRRAELNPAFVKQLTGL